MEILMDLQVLSSPEFENHTFSDLPVCVPVISITITEIKAETPNLVLYISITYKCYVKFLTQIGQIVCVQDRGLHGSGPGRQMRVDFSNELGR